MNALSEIVIILALVNFLLSWFVAFRLHQPTTVFMWVIKVFVCALSPILLMSGLLIAIIGWILHQYPAVVIGSLSALPYLVYIIRSTRPPDAFTGFEKAFGEQWKNQIPPDRTTNFLTSRHALKLPAVPDPVFLKNIPFYTIPETNRKLLCDVWQPPAWTNRSGLAFIYLHGSAWTFLDKDYGTNRFFRHLASQGHVIMDVAYRLFPETDFTGMVHDAKHAIAWMKANADVYGLNPERIVIGGGSAGAHITQLAAYTHANKLLTPPDLHSTDVSVRGVISLYTQADLRATYYHTCQHLALHSALAQKGEGSAGGMPPWLQKRMGEDFHRLGFNKEVAPGMLAPILGGSPDEKPESYALFSPFMHVHKNCPPTLFIHGTHDILAPVKPVVQLFSHLQDEGVPAVLHLIPQTDHAFDLILPAISPSAHNCYYDVERFLALMV